MKIVLLTFFSALLLAGCSSKPVKTAAVEPKKVEKQEEPAFDSKKPISYAEYKKWREQNDPDSNAYAEYKQWEINQRKWKLENDR